MFGNSAIHLVRFLVGLDAPQTQTTAVERALIVSHLSGARRIVEVGVFEGYTTRVLTEHADEGAVVWGIDPFFTGRLGVCWGYHVAKIYNAAALRSGRLRVVRALSVEVGDKVPSEVDFVFIDADHSLEGITADWDFWSARISPGGRIALHDVIVPPHKPQVADFGSHRFFESTIRHDPRFSVVETAGSLSILRKA